MRTARLQSVHVYSGGIFAAGFAVAVTLLATSMPLGIERRPLFWAFAAVVVLGELFPVSIPRQDDTISITVSTTFAFAVLLFFGTGPGTLVYALASVIGDIVTRTTWWKALFNFGQYALTVAASGALLDSAIGLGNGLTRFEGHELPWIAAAGAVFFLMNVVALGGLRVLGHDIPLPVILREELSLHGVVTGTLLAIAPIVVVVAETAPLLVPMILAPMVVAYWTAKVTGDKDHQSMHDSLTGLPNRVLFFRRVNAALRVSHASSASTAVMIVDLDHFKEINDTLGHHVGDLLLVEVGKRLAEVTGSEAAVARLGGDEFAVLLRSVLDRSEVEHTAAELIDALEQPFTIADTRLDVGASVGSALFPEHGGDAERLIQRAEIAMGAAKSGPGTPVIYSSTLDQHSPERLALVGELRQAIAERRLLLNYQPKVSLRTGQVDGLEALARWVHPQRGFIPPDEFIPLAERTGLIRPLTTLVVEEALRQYLQLREAGHDLSVAVNLSARILGDPQFPDELAELLATAGVEASKLHLEITESMIMEDRSRSMEVLDQLHEMGHPLSIDDFGTGYSSLAYLKRLPVDEIKIDKSFILNLGVDSDDEMIARSTVDLGHNLRLRVVAEGVETPEAWHKLAEMGCDQAQGFLMSRPLPPGELGRWLATWRPRQLQWLPVR
jgi:diguanylate cyclase (GGDEF)-like protein